MPDMVTMLKNDHREVERMLDRLEETEEGTERSQLLEQLSRALSLHMEIEESLVYPYLADVVGEEPDLEAHTEHDLARTGLRQLEALQGEPGFGAAVAMLRGGIQHHVQEEERELLPAIKSGLDRDTYRELGDRIEEAKREAGQPPAPSRRSAADATRGATKRASTSGAERSKSSAAKRSSSSKAGSAKPKQSGSPKRGGSRSSSSSRSRSRS